MRKTRFKGTRRESKRTHVEIQVQKGEEVNLEERETEIRKIT